MSRFLLALTVVSFTILIAGCTTPAPPSDPTPVMAVSTTPTYTLTAIPRASAIPTETPSPTPSPTPTRMVPPVDSTTLYGKVLFGYQGWFSCVGDGAGYSDWEPSGSWIHWFQYHEEPVVSALTVDFWPDTSELTEDEICLTDMKLPNGSPVVAFSSYNLQTVVRHFKWMEEYGIDGVELNRFVAGLDGPDNLDFRDKVAHNVRTGAEIHGRFFYIQYDISGAEPGSLLAHIKRDWAHLVDDLRLTESPQYLHHNGLPVIGLWGFGFTGREYRPDQAMELLEFFHSNTQPEYRATVKGGVPSFWRTGTEDAEEGDEWARVFRAFDILSPWAVGRYTSEEDVNRYTSEVTIPDLSETASLGIDYMPVVFPGFSWANLFPGETYNVIPRDGGKFYWRQVFNAISAGAKTLYVAMFDEVDEGTAMFKLAATEQELPVGGVLVPLDIDGYDLPSDWYLQLGGMTGRMLREEIPLSPNLPIQPESFE